MREGEDEGLVSRREWEGDLAGDDVSRGARRSCSGLGGGGGRVQHVLSSPKR